MPEERARIVAAMVELVGKGGFHRTELGDVLLAAGVSERTFARHFSDKEDCFLQAWDELTMAHGVRASRAFDAPGPWVQRMRATAWVSLDYLQADLNRTRFLVLEILNAGEVARAHRDLAIAAQVEWIDAGRREPSAPAGLTRATAVHIAGAINELLIRKTRSGEIANGNRVLRELMYLAVRPYLGEEAARAELTMPAPAGVGE